MAHSASFHPAKKIAQSNPEIKHLAFQKDERLRDVFLLTKY